MLPRSRGRNAFNTLLELLFYVALPATPFVGSLVVLQGERMQNLGGHLGGQPWDYAFSGAASLAGSLSVFLLLFGIVCACGYARVLHFRKLFEKGNFQKRFFVSGAPGALYITFYAASIAEISAAIATVAGTFGLMMYAVVASWHRLGPARPYVIGGAICIFLATASASLGYADGALYVSFGDLLFVAGMGMFGAGIGWQFSVLGDMQKVSSALASAIISAATGLVTALVVVAGFAVYRGTLAPDNPWPSPVADFSMYLASLAGAGIILIGAFAKAQLSKPAYNSALTFGSLATGFTIDLLSLSLSPTTIALRLGICAVALLGVYLCVLDVEKSWLPRLVRAISPIPATSK